MTFFVHCKAYCFVIFVFIVDLSKVTEYVHLVRKIERAIDSDAVNQDKKSFSDIVVLWVSHVSVPLRLACCCVFCHVDISLKEAVPHVKGV